MASSDRRVSPRAAVLRPGVLSVPVSEDGEMEPYHVTVLDTSEGGCRVRISIKLENGTPVQLRMLDSGHVLQGVVRYSRQPLDNDEFHVGIQYFHPEDPIGDSTGERTAGSEVLSLLDEGGAELGSLKVRMVQDSLSQVVVIAPRFVFPDTDLRLTTPTTVIFGRVLRCGAAIGGYRLSIASSSRQFLWRSLLTHPLEAIRYAMQSMRPPGESS